MVQWLRIHFAKQGTQVQSLVQEDSTCLGAATPCATTNAGALEPESLSYGSLYALKRVLRNKRSHPNKQPVDCNYRAAPACRDESEPTRSNDAPVEQKKKVGGEP